MQTAFATMPAAYSRRVRLLVLAAVIGCARSATRDEGISNVSTQSGPPTRGLNTFPVTSGEPPACSTLLSVHEARLAVQALRRDWHLPDRRPHGLRDSPARELRVQLVLDEQHNDAPVVVCVSPVRTLMIVGSMTGSQDGYCVQRKQVERGVLHVEWIRFSSIAS